MDFAVKSVVLFLLVVEAFGRTIPLENGSSNATKINHLIPSEGGVSCDLDGVSYPPDATFAVSDDPCLVCQCDRNWTGSVINSTCFREECEDPQDSKLEEGCIPVYDEKKCCIIEFYCSGNEVSINEESSEVESNDTSEGSDEVVCPTPLCADASCRIEVPPGWKCPTCICNVADAKEKNDLEPENAVSVEEPYGSQNATEDSEMFLVPVSWSGVTKEGYVEEPEDDEEANEEEYEAVEGDKPEVMEEGQEEREHSETTLVDSSVNVIPGEDSKPNEPRRRRRASSQTGPYGQQQQQGWTVLDEEDDEREREDESGEDVEDLQAFGSNSSEGPTGSSVEESEETNIVEQPVAPWCPTPTCEHSGCRIGVLPGHQCPTCICSERRRQP